MATGQPVKLFSDFFVFEQTLRNGVFLTAGDLEAARPAVRRLRFPEPHLTELDRIAGR